jgi:hypothetical protein
VAANDMTKALKHPHPEIPFAQVKDDTKTVITQLAAIFKNKFQKSKAPELTQAPLKAAENKLPAALTQPTLASLNQHKYQNRSQNPVPANTSSNTPLPRRLVTPMTGQAASPKYRREHKIFLAEICHKKISGTWRPPTWPLHWAPIIGPRNIFLMQ